MSSHSSDDAGPSGLKGKGESALSSSSSHSQSSCGSDSRYYMISKGHLAESDASGAILDSSEVEKIGATSPRQRPKVQENPWPYLQSLFKFVPSADPTDRDNLSFQCVLCGPKNAKTIRAHRTSKGNLKTHLERVHKDKKNAWVHLMSLRGKTDPIDSTPKTGATSRRQLTGKEEEKEKRREEEVEKMIEREEGVAHSDAGELCSVSIASTSTSSHKRATKIKQQMSMVYALNRIRSEPSKVNRVITNFIVGEMLPFSTVDKDTFRDMLTTLNPEVEIFGRKAFVNHLKDVFRQKKTALIRILQEDVSWVATTADLWSAHNKYVLYSLFLFSERLLAPVCSFCMSVRWMNLTWVCSVCAYLVPATYWLKLSMRTFFCSFQGLSRRHSTLD